METWRNFNVYKVLVTQLSLSEGMPRDSAYLLRKAGTMSKHEAQSFPLAYGC